MRARYRLTDLLARFLARCEAICTRSNAGPAPGEPIEAAVSVPANATARSASSRVDAFRRAGFDVVAMLNEPSAAGFEYTHRYRSTITSRREHIVVYDLGGGTFDASLVHMTGHAPRRGRHRGHQPARRRRLRRGDPPARPRRCAAAKWTTPRATC